MLDFDFAARVQLYLPSQPLNEVPARPGVYLLFDEQQRVRRLVTTRDLRARARYYLHEREGAEGVSVARRDAAAMGWLPTFSRFETLYAHLCLFRSYFPEAFQSLYRLPTPHLLRLTLGEAYPRLLPARSLSGEGHLHVGPYLTREMAEQEAAFLNELLELRRCDYEIQPFQPYERCLYLQIGSCVAPCDRFPAAAYLHLAGQAAALLGGQAQAVQAQWVAQRDAAAEALDFEAAMRWRDRGRAATEWLARRPPFLRPLEQLNLVVPQRTEFGLDLFVVREGALAEWLRLNEGGEAAVEQALAASFGRPWQRPAWPTMRDDFAFLSRWLWDRSYSAHILMDDPAEAARAILAWAEQAVGEIAEEGQTEDLPF